MRFGKMGKALRLSVNAHVDDKVSTREALR